MQGADMVLEMSALWRRVALLEEDNRTKTKQIGDLKRRLESLSSPAPSRSDSAPPTYDRIDLSSKTDDSVIVIEDEGEDPVKVTNSERGGGAAEVLDEEADLVEKLQLGEVLERFPEPVIGRLHKHQRVGAAFLYSVLKSNSGTIFADALGLGKTLQMISALYLFWIAKFHKISNPKLLILAPLTVIPHWADEVVRFNTWLGSSSKRFPFPFLIDATMSLDFRTDVLRQWASSGGLLIISYSMFRELQERKPDRQLILDDPGADVAVLDEGHKICNVKSSIHNLVCSMRTARRIVISGYPLQNHLRELYTLMTFVDKNKCRSIFGPPNKFTNEYEKVIYGFRTTKPNVSKNRAFVLYEKIRLNRLFFRRDNRILHKCLPPKTEIIVKIRLSPAQHRLWLECIEQRNSLDGLTLHGIATMICDHPQIARRQMDHDSSIQCRQWLRGIDPDVVDHESAGKMVLLMALLERCRAAGEKVVVFSKWVKALSFIEEMILNHNRCHRCDPAINAIRFDGSTSIAERKSLIEQFNRSCSSADCFLISTLCGEGISLVAANRVVILEPNWNPSVDRQAAYRVYRIGQTKPVFIYRFIMHDMFEDLVFQRQLEKIETTNWVMDGRSRDVSNRIDTQWREFIREPTPLSNICGPTHLQLSPFALRDQITSFLLEKYGTRSSTPLISNDDHWIVAAVEQSKFFDDNIDTRGFDQLDSALAFEELEYDRIYPRGTPSRDATLVNKVRRLTTIPPEESLGADHDADDFYSEGPSPVPGHHLVTLGTLEPDPTYCPDLGAVSCLIPLGSEADRKATAESSRSAGSGGAAAFTQSDDESWLPAISLAPFPAAEQTSILPRDRFSQHPDRGPRSRAGSYNESIEHARNRAPNRNRADTNLRPPYVQQKRRMDNAKQEATIQPNSKRSRIQQRKKGQASRLSHGSNAKVKSERQSSNGNNDRSHDPNRPAPQAQVQGGRTERGDGDRAVGNDSGVSASHTRFD